MGEGTRRTRYGVPRASYRLQLHRGFTFADARAIVPYLAQLGITHVYLSPIFAAAPGSMHGYDVFDHQKINPEIGGAAGLYALGEALAAHHMGLILDIVPNHVGVAGGRNPWWRSVLRYGAASPYAPYFDIDWEAQPHMASGVLVFPILGKPFGQALEAGELRLEMEDDEVVVRYFDTSLPLRPESYSRVLSLPPIELSERLSDPAAMSALASALEDLSGGDVESCDAALPRLRALIRSEPAIAAAVRDAVEAVNGSVGEPASFDRLEDLLRTQHYRLADWRVAGAEVNYRRFFDQNTLAAIRMERDDVFEETHRLVFDLAANGLVTAVRVDHVDGLYAPGDYLERLSTGLRKSTEGFDSAETPVYVEKILQEGERLPECWPIDGTTGYEAMTEIDRLFIDPAGARESLRTYLDFLGVPVRYDEVRHEAKRQVAREAFAGEISVLGYQAQRIAQRNRLHRDNTLRSLRDAVAATVTCFPVYRTYLGNDERRADETAYIDQAIDEALQRNPHLSEPAFAFLREVLTLAPGGLSTEEMEQRAHFRRRFQQITGPIMAKGLEDTTFFRFNQLLSLNEVGGDPSVFGGEVADSHRWFAERAERWPKAMTASSTHDTKRSEDVRARLHVLSELPHVWRREVRLWARINERHVRYEGGERAPDRNLEYAIYQTLVGSWPAAGERAEYQERLHQYLVKAMREAKLQTGWARPNEPFEAGVLAFVDALLDPRRSAAFLRRLEAFVGRIAPAATRNMLGALTVKVLAPGFPDFYQGCELPELSLTDPDNRRPVDFDRRVAMLREASGSDDPPCCESPDAKLWLTHRLLRIRARRPEALAGAYQPVSVTGTRALHVFAFARGPQELVVVVPRLTAAATGDGRAFDATFWTDTAVNLPEGERWTDAISGRVVEGGMVRIADMLGGFPVAVLEPA